MYISFTTSLPILRHQHLKTTKKLQNMIENTLLEIGQLRIQAEQSVDIPSPGATGVAAAPAVAAFICVQGLSYPCHACYNCCTCCTCCHLFL